MKLFRTTFRAESKQAHQFNQLITPHVDALYQSAFKLTGSQVDAEDVVQDVLIKLYPKTQELKEVAELRPWLFRVLYNQFIDHCRKQARNPAGGKNRQQSSDCEIIDILPSTDPKPDELCEAHLQSTRVLTALAVLSYDKRALIVLHLIEGFSLEELTKILDAPIGTLKSRLHRVKAELKRLLEEEPFHSAERGKDRR